MRARKVEVHRIVLTVIDHDGLGGMSVRDVLEGTSYANHCMSPTVESVETRVVSWHDAHPLNNPATQEQALADLFAGCVTHSAGSVAR
jgi:hypothetical protein